MNERDTSFLTRPRLDPGYRPRGQRLKDWRAVERQLTSRELREQAARCMDCGVPFCHAYGCPLENTIPEINALAYAGRWDEAWDLLAATNPMAEFTARVCPALCEGSCVAGLNGEAVTIRQVERMVVERAFQSGYIRPRPPAFRRGEQIAVIGSGPAGLSAAWHLNRKGYRVTVFESAPKPGGMLRYGIPDFKLEKWVIDRRIRLMQEEGILFETGIEAGHDFSARFLCARFDATVLACGAREPRDLDVPGRELEGVCFAMTYLTQQNRRVDNEIIPAGESISVRGRTVTVIGGGDTGSFCGGAAWRRGAGTVYQFEILPRPPPQRSPTTPWPQWPLLLRESSSHQEGCERRWSVTTKRLEGRDGRVMRLHACEVEWVRGGTGRMEPREMGGSEFAIDTDLVLLAMGFTGPARNRYAEELRLERDGSGFILRDGNHMASRAGVFVAGDMSLGASLVVRAFEDGARTARCVDGYLRRGERS